MDMEYIQEYAKEAWEITLSDGKDLLRIMEHAANRIVTTGKYWDPDAGRAAVGETSREEFPMKLYICQTVVLLLINWGVRLFIVQPVIHFAMKQYAAQRKVVKYSIVRKYAQSFMECLFYSTGSLIGFLVCAELPWIWPSVQWWMSLSNVMEPGVRFYYIFTGAWYTQGFICLMLEDKRKDFMEMVIHHIVTVALVVLSFQYGMVRVGLVIMSLFNFADPFLHAAKQVKYFADLKKQKGLFSLSTLADILFGGFVVSFAGTRNVLYPYVVYSAVVEQYEYVTSVHGPLEVFRYMEVIGTPTVVMIVLLVVLLALQMFWFWLIVKVIASIISGQELADSRSDSESDSDIADKKNQ